MQHDRLFSSRALQAHDYMDTSLQMRVKGRWASADSLYALQINPKYDPTPLLIPHTYTSGGQPYEAIVYSYNGLTYDGESFWLASNSTNGVYRLSLAGNLIDEFDAPGRGPLGLGYDGQDLWLADGSDRVFKLSQSGQALCSFSAPTHRPGSLAWGAGRLWLAEFQGSPVFGLDADSSCAVGSPAVVDTFQISGSSAAGTVGNALTWNGEHLLVAHNLYGTSRLYVMTTSGDLVRQIELPVHDVRGIVWDGDALWMLHGGPKEVGAYDPVLSRFQLP